MLSVLDLLVKFDVEQTVWRKGPPADTAPETECEGLNLEQWCANWEGKFFSLEEDFI